MASNIKGNRVDNLKNRVHHTYILFCEMLVSVTCVCACIFAGWSKMHFLLWTIVRKVQKPLT